MKFTKRILSITFAAVLLLTLIPMGFQVGAAVSGDYEYTVSNGEATITKYNGKAEILEILATLGGYPVKVIGDKAFYNCKSLIKVTIPNGVVRIEREAFVGCTSLAVLNMPDSIKNVALNAFKAKAPITVQLSKKSSVYNGNEGNLLELFEEREFELRLFTHVAIKNGLVYGADGKSDNAVITRYIGNAKKLTIPKTIGKYSILTIRSLAFRENKTLTNVTIPSSVTKVDVYAFQNCPKLKTVTFKSTSTKIEKDAFRNSDSVKIICYAGSTAETYAKKYKIPFATLARNSYVKLSKTTYTYDGEEKKPTVTVKIGDKTLKRGTDYSVTYSEGRTKVGQYTVTVKFKGNYSGTIKKTYTIKPKATTVSTVTAKSKGFKVSWSKRTAQVKGYQIQYSTDKNFSKNNAKITVPDNAVASRSVTELKGDKTYYVRVRTYKTVNIDGKSTKLYSKWSAAKSVTTKN